MYTFFVKHVYFKIWENLAKDYMEYKASEQMLSLTLDIDKTLIM